jgi:NAD+ diphosphatase
VGADLVGPDGPILLGLEDGSALFAIDLDELGEAARRALLANGEIVSLRDAGAILSHAEGGLAAYIVALLNWHRRHRFCANCGAPTSVGAAGLVRRCGDCGASHFPRTDPVVIMLVESDGRALLGSRAGWPGGRYSILAGYVEPGETPEQAVIREVREESAITAYAPRYVSSQPWPFPSSLMLGFEALSDGGDPTASDGELSDVRWFTREQLQAAQSGAGEIQLPPPISIARMLIDRWVARQR